MRKTFQHGPNEDFYEADTVVIAAGNKALGCLFEEFTGVFPVYTVGDANKAGKVKDAIKSAFLAAMEI